MADFFSSSVRDMTFGRGAPLYRERVQENIRLEYKRELPGEAGDFKKVLAKELSSLANTYGGYVVIGIATISKAIRPLWTVFHGSTTLLSALLQ